MADVKDVEEQQREQPLVTKAAIFTYSFLRAVGMKVGMMPTPNSILSYTLVVNDITEEAVPFGTNFVIDSSTLSVYEVEETDESLENFAYTIAKKVQTGMFEEKCNRVRIHNKTEVAKSRIHLPT